MKARVYKSREIFIIALTDAQLLREKISSTIIIPHWLMFYGEWQHSPGKPTDKSNRQAQQIIPCSGWSGTSTADHDNLCWDAIFLWSGCSHLRWPCFLHGSSVTIERETEMDFVEWFWNCWNANRQINFSILFFLALLHINARLYISLPLIHTIHNNHYMKPQWSRTTLVDEKTKFHEMGN